MRSDACCRCLCQSCGFGWAIFPCYTHQLNVLSWPYQEQQHSSDPCTVPLCLAVSSLLCKCCYASCAGVPVGAVHVLQSWAHTAWQALVPTQYFGGSNPSQNWCVGIHGDAGPAPAAQPAAAPLAGGGGEPQLTLRGAGGARRWGPAHYEAAPAAAPAASTSARTPSAGLCLCTCCCKPGASMISTLKVH